MTEPTYRCKKESVEVVMEGKSYQINLHATAEESSHHWYVVGSNNQFQSLEQAIRSLPTTTTQHSPIYGMTPIKAKNQLTK